MAQVLLVEDDQWIADCYQQWLRGHTVHHARDAQQALDMADSHVPDVIMLDLFLPYANGVQLLHTLRSHTDLNHVPVLLCTGHPPDGAVQMEAYGVRRVLDKATLTPRMLQEAIKEATEHAAV
jgi:CheY-like chemotaxis protein